jgi:hypothetical protein
MNHRIMLCLALVLSFVLADCATAPCDAAIIHPKAPDGGRQIVRENAGEILRTDPRFLGGFRIEELTIGDPYRDYGVGLTNLASGRLLSAAASGGSWMYLLIHGTTAVGAAGLIADEKTGKALRSNGLYQTDFSNETLEALRMADKLPQIKKQDYELRRLDIPSISFVAVWLHAKSDDIIIPLPPTYGRWNAYQPYSEKHMIKLLKPEAGRDMEMWKKLDEQERKNVDAYRQAMMDYEKAHGGKCGSIVYSGMSAPYQFVGPHVEIIRLQGSSSKCGRLDYKVKITYEDNRRIAKQVEVLEKITQ